MAVKGDKVSINVDGARVTGKVRIRNETELSVEITSPFQGIHGYCSLREEYCGKTNLLGKLGSCQLGVLLTELFDRCTEIEAQADKFIEELNAYHNELKSFDAATEARFLEKVPAQPEGMEALLGDYLQERALGFETDRLDIRELVEFDSYDKWFKPLLNGETVYHCQKQVPAYVRRMMERKA